MGRGGTEWCQTPLVWIPFAVKLLLKGNGICKSGVPTTTRPRHRCKSPHRTDDSSPWPGSEHQWANVEAFHILAQVTELLRTAALGPEIHWLRCRVPPLPSTPAPLFFPQKSNAAVCSAAESTNYVCMTTRSPKSLTRALRVMWPFVRYLLLLYV